MAEISGSNLGVMGAGRGLGGGIPKGARARRNRKKISTLCNILQ